MCRLFGLHAGTPIRATFWLLDAANSLSTQSRREPDGAGIGVFGQHGEPIVDKQPLAAWQDRQFAAEARALTSAMFVAHVRYASTGENTVLNTHPFSQDGRIFAHNGAVADLDVLDRQLSTLGVRDLVSGQTDSERVFALITGHIRSHGGDIDLGLTRALLWMTDNLPIYALNLVMATPSQLWALRYPDTHELYVLDRARGGHRGQEPLHADSSRIQAQSEDLSRQRAVVLASERMDEDPGWRLLNPGELIRVDAGLAVHSSYPLPQRPRKLLGLGDLDLKAATSQRR